MPTTKKPSKPQEQNRLPLIHCRCGAEILVIPDVKAMDKAIEAHLAACQTIKQSKDKGECTKELHEYLIKQVFDVAVAEAKPEKEQTANKAWLKGDTAPLL
ncbi:MAG TPA: hypothetical protein VLH35_07885 [Candidatus Acidoferrales bacterium]|nr:hypothetical protein [Candidatus Acidoferrales bacterium]